MKYDQIISMKMDYNRYSNNFIPRDVFNDVLKIYPGMFRMEDDKLFCINPEYCQGELKIHELEFRNLYLHCNTNGDNVTITLDMTRQDGRLIQHAMNLSDEACVFLFGLNITPCCSDGNSNKFVYYDTKAIERRITIKNIIEDGGN